MNKEEFNILLQDVFQEGYSQAELDAINEGMFDGIKTWYKRRLTPDELKETENEFKKVAINFKFPKGIDVKYNFGIKKGTYKVFPLSVAQHKHHIFNKNGVANFVIYDGNMVNPWKVTDIVHDFIDTLNKNSKNFKYVVSKTATSYNGGGFFGMISAYRKKDEIEKDMPSDKSDRIKTLSRTDILVY